ncbi:hypothetical protein [Streptomyces sp. ME18-1-4]|uniref:hypothetical protein n=1 Tax=Streptomyces sp. ME18-1-4 TaxID=3028685 RepID=UPI0029A07F22|nr:hypothetical protein [Streptomyces sp. ME18-1-4]MDX3242056.1 hypothetical protein [Streptomyces sp. ME18-1-4]
MSSRTILSTTAATAVQILGAHYADRIDREPVFVTGALIDMPVVFPFRRDRREPSR